MLSPGLLLNVYVFWLSSNLPLSPVEYPLSLLDRKPRSMVVGENPDPWWLILGGPQPSRSQLPRMVGSCNTQNPAMYPPNPEIVTNGNGLMEMCPKWLYCFAWLTILQVFKKANAFLQSPDGPATPETSSSNRQIGSADGAIEAVGHGRKESVLGAMPGSVAAVVGGAGGGGLPLPTVDLDVLDQEVSSGQRT